METKRNIGQPVDTVLSIRLSGDQYSALKALCAREHRTLSQQIRHYVDLGLARDNEEQAA